MDTSLDCPPAFCKNTLPFILLVLGSSSDAGPVPVAGEELQLAVPATSALAQAPAVLRTFFFLLTGSWRKVPSTVASWVQQRPLRSLFRNNVAPITDDVQTLVSRVGGLVLPARRRLVRILLTLP